MPPVPFEAHYLIDALFDVGPVQSSGMSEGAISHLELQAWQQNNGIRLNWWEVSTIRQLSKEYAVQLSKRDRNEPRPYMSAAEMDAERRRKIAESMEKWAAQMSRKTQ